MGLGSRLIGTALVLGVGALAVAAVFAAPKVLRAARPLVREGLKLGLGLYESARASAAEFAEDVEDILAEVRAELRPERGAHAEEAQGGAQREARG